MTVISLVDNDTLYRRHQARHNKIPGREITPFRVFWSISLWRLTRAPTPPTCCVVISHCCNEIFQIAVSSLVSSTFFFLFSVTEKHLITTIKQKKPRSIIFCSSARGASKILVQKDWDVRSWYLIYGIKGKDKSVGQFARKLHNQNGDRTMIVMFGSYWENAGRGQK